MLGNTQPPPTPTEEQALDFLTETLRSGENVGRNNYEVYLSELVGRYVRLRITVPPGIAIADHVEKLITPFYAAAWSLCRLGDLRPGPTPHAFRLCSVCSRDVRWLAEALGATGSRPTSD